MREPSNDLLRAAALALVGVALLAPWFTRHDDVFRSEQTSERWGLLYEHRCSSFAMPAVTCRWSNANDEVARELVPLFVVTRLATLAALVVLLLAVARRSRSTRHFALATLVLAAVHIGALPGDMQYEEHVPSIGAFCAVAGALAAFAYGLGWQALSLERRRAAVFATAAGCYALLAALWLPWAHQYEALFPPDPREQSAYSFTLLAKVHHWHDLRHEREHYLEDSLWTAEDEHRVPWRYGAEGSGGHLNPAALRHVHWLPLFGCVLGLAFAVRSFAAASRGDASHAWTERLAFGAAFLGLGVATWLREANDYWHAVVPGSGVLAAAAALALTVWLGRQRPHPDAKNDGDEQRIRADERAARAAVS